MAGILDGMRIIEGSAFVAAPLGGMAMAQLGADVIRFDPIGGGLDRGRWPVTAEGRSLFWAGLNKGKRSIQVDLGSEEGQGAGDGADHRARTRRRPVPDQLPGTRLPRLRGAHRAPAGPRDGEHRGQPRRLVGRGLHGEPGHRLPLGHRPAQPQRALQPPAAGLGRHHRDDGHHQPAGGRAPEDSVRRGPVRAARALRRGLLDGGGPGEGRRGADQPPRAAEGRQLPLRGIRPRLHDQGRPPGDDRGAHRRDSGRGWWRPPGWARPSTPSASSWTWTWTTRAAASRRGR